MLESRKTWQASSELVLPLPRVGQVTSPSFSTHFISGEHRHILRNHSLLSQDTFFLCIKRCQDFHNLTPNHEKSLTFCCLLSLSRLEVVKKKKKEEDDLREALKKMFFLGIIPESVEV